MKKISELKRLLSKNFNWHQSRIDCFARILLSLFSVKTVNLSELSVALVSKAEVASRYKRLQRFFRYFKIDYEFFAKLIFRLFVTNKKIYLVLDRTNWFWGKTKINILTLGITHEGVAIPLLWELLDKAGNATASEHQTIIERFIKLFGTKNIAGILADREFGSGHLFCWLNKKKIPFYIRIKDNSIITIKNKKKHKEVKKIFNHLQHNQTDCFGMSVKIFGQGVYLAGSRSQRGELMVVATNDSPKNAIAVYLRRWEIESLFCCLKTRGFNFESTHLTHLDRIGKMLGLLAIGLCWAHKVGEWRAEKKPIRWAKHKDFLRVTLRPQNSYFRYGLDFIREIILSPFKKLSLFTKCLTLLLPPMNIGSEMAF